MSAIGKGNGFSEIRTKPAVYIKFAQTELFVLAGIEKPPAKLTGAFN